MFRKPFKNLTLCAAAIGAVAIAAFAGGPLRAAEEAVVIPGPSIDVQSADGIQTAVIAGARAGDKWNPED